MRHTVSILERAASIGAARKCWIMKIKSLPARGWLGTNKVHDTLHCLLTATLLSLVASASWAADITFRPNPPPSLGQGGPETFDPSRLSMGRGFKVLLGKKVKDAQEVAVGKIEDFVVDIEGGAVLGVLVSGSGKGEAMVPASSFQSALEFQMQIRETRAVFAKASRVPGAQALLQNPEAIKAALAYFTSPQTVANPARLRSAGTLVGTALTCDSGEVLGKVHDVFLDLTAARLFYLVVEPVVGPEAGSRLYLVPPASVAVQPQGLTLRASATHFLAGRYINREFPTDIVMSDVGVAVYGHYGLLSGGNSRTVAGSAVAAGATKTPEVAVRSDHDLSKDVLTEIIRNNDAMVVMSIKVVSQNGRVILSGAVKSEAERANIAAAACRVVGTGNVDNRLEVKGKVRTASL